VRIVNAIIIFILLLALSLNACSDSEQESPEISVTGNPVIEEKEPMIITIGNLTDLTGVSSSAMSIINKALDDVVRYYNEENLIPGVKLEVTSFDGQYDSALYITGYESLKRKGADLIWAPLPISVSSLKTVVDEDQFMLFTATGTMDDLMPPGYAFSLGIMPQFEAYTLLKWIAENDPDFPAGRPAKIGGAAWADAYSDVFLNAMEAYATAYPQQYDYVGGYLTNFAFSWTTQVEDLKDCDYIYIPTPPQAFVEQYRDAGGTATFLASDVQSALLGMMDSADFWNKIDGTYFIRSSRWYNETGQLIDMTNELLDRYRPEEAHDIKRNGCGYIGAKHVYLMCDIIKEAVETVGPESFDTQALYDAAATWTYIYEDISDFNNFSSEKRYASNYYAVYEARACETPDDSDLFRAHDDWLPQVMEP